MANEGKHAQSLQSAEREVREQLVDVKQTLKERENAILGLQERLHQVDNEHTELKTTLQKREEHFQEQLGQLADAKKTLAQEFENLANKIFRREGQGVPQEQPDRDR